MVDPRCNSIKQIGTVGSLKCFNIIELYVEGNPFMEKPGYVDEVRELFNQIFLPIRSCIGQNSGFWLINKILPCDDDWTPWAAIILPMF